MAMEMGPFLASQAASSETEEGQYQGPLGPSRTWPVPIPSLTHLAHCGLVLLNH